MTATLEIDLPADLARFRLPAAVAARLQWLLDPQHNGTPLTAEEREEAAGLVDLAELLTLLRLRAERAVARVTFPPPSALRSLCGRATAVSIANCRNSGRRPRFAAQCDRLNKSRDRQRQRGLYSSSVVEATGCWGVRCGESGGSSRPSCLP